MASKIAFAACVFFAAHGVLATTVIFSGEPRRDALWFYALNWALAWMFAYLALI